MVKPTQNNTQYFKKLGKRIRELRIEKGYSSHETFAYDIDISRSQYWRYENGSDLKLSSLLILTNAFNITLAEFFSKGFD